ncbi:MAG: alpha/beta hydrolase fold domain-containing protein, partial [Pacificimonas sp.]
LASPLFGNLNEMPPMLIQAAAHDSLVDEAADLAKRAEAAGVDVTYEAYPEMVHVFQVFHAMLTPGREALDKVARFVRATA